MLELLLAVMAFIAGYHEGKDKCQTFRKDLCPPCTTIVVSPSDTLRIRWWNISPIPHDWKLNSHGMSIDSTKRTW